MLGSVLVLLASGGLVIPEPDAPEPTRQMSTLKGLTLKYNDRSEIRYFLKSIIKNDGYLCLGTSESSPTKQGNYQDFLNNDPDISVAFSRLAGAGRTSGVNIPWLLHQRDLLDSLKIIYLINPVYWRKGLNRPLLSYGNRYHHPEICRFNSKDYPDLELALSPVNAYLNELTFIQSCTAKVEYWLRQSRVAFFSDLRIRLGLKAFGEGFSYTPKSKISLDKFDHFGTVNTTDVDTVWNARHSFEARTSTQRIDESSDYRYEELIAFIDFCRKTGIEATFILGPYNKRFMAKSRPETVAPFKVTTDRIRGTLEAEGARYVDATDISNTAGAFNDYQHHSAYGAYLIYKKLKPMVK